MGSENILPGISLKDENKQLENIIDIAQENLDNARRSVEKLNEDLSDLREVYDAQDKEGLVLWNNAAVQLEENKRNVLRCEKARKKPYFGRIDFKDPKQKDEEAYYIGRVGIAKNASEPVVIDWRAPIASVYYENSLGPCKYTVSSEGTFEIDLKRKRTYEIADDKLVDFFDSDVVANDELLTKYLAKNKKAVLGEIIATIQQEQNMIIRRSPKTNIIVQGVAGSGKTTVAMHRISYILYNYAEDFRPEDFYIIGSNRILLNYITSVLPELDVYGIKQMTMEQLFIRLLYEDWDDKKYKVCNVRKDDTGNYIKGSRKWFGQLEGFCCEYEKKCISSKEVYMEKTNTLLVGKVLVDTYLKDNPLMSMQSKIHMLNEIIYSKYENEVLGREVMFPAKERKILDKKYKYFYGKDDWKGSIYELYNEFLKSQAENGYDIDIPEDEFDVYDLAALAYIYKRIKETDPVREASHVVIDEAQDFGMMAYCCLHYCLRNCTYTIMGDTSQNIYFKYGLNDWEDLKELVLTGTYDAFGLLRKSYRNTVEISNFATEILRHGDFSIYPVEPIIRHGNPVKITEYGNVRSLIAGAAETITGWQKDGFETIAVVCRDERETKKVSEELKKYIDIADEDLNTAEFGDGVMVLPVAYTKGLEFDAVLLFDPSERKYPSDDGNVKLLYVAATRALHELAVLHRGKLTELIAKPAPKDKHQEEFASEPLTKAKEYEKKTFTEKEILQQQRIYGKKEMDARDYMGPSKIELKPEQIIKNMEEVVDLSRFAGKPKSQHVKGVDKKPVTRITSESNVDKAIKQQGDVLINQSPYSYGAIPDNALLRIKGHSKGRFAVKWLKKTKSHVEIASFAGILYITPITPQIIRITFTSGTKPHDTCWVAQAKSHFKWSAKESRSLIEIATEKVVLRIEKANGAIKYMTPERKILVCENEKEPRILSDGESYVFFDWERSEKIKSKGILHTDLSDLTSKAKYISFGQRPMRLPLIVSSKGYGIAPASARTALVCNIKTYGQYIYADGDTQSDYYFIYGAGAGRVIELYNNNFQHA